LVNAGVLCADCLVLFKDLKIEKHKNRSNRYCKGREIYIVHDPPGHRRLCSLCNEINSDEIKALSEFIVSEL